MRKSKTFQIDEDVSKPYFWLDEIIWGWPCAETIEARDPADTECLLTRKVKITIEVYEDKE